MILYEVARRRYPGTEADANFSETEDSDNDADGPESAPLSLPSVLANINDSQVNSSLLLNEPGGSVPDSQA